jgi:hypothetical protein
VPCSKNARSPFAAGTLAGIARGGYEARGGGCRMLFMVLSNCAASKRGSRGLARIVLCEYGWPSGRVGAGGDCCCWPARGEDARRRCVGGSGGRSAVGLRGVTSSSSMRARAGSARGTSASESSAWWSTRETRPGPFGGKGSYAAGSASDDGVGLPA